jgi:hypothetical protein
MIWFLADASSTSAIIWLIALLAVLIVGLMAVLQIKKWLVTPDLPERAGFSLSDLRRMHKEGRMTDEEFEKAKVVIIGAAKTPAPKPADPPPPGSGNAPQL